MEVKAIKAYRIEELQPGVKNSVINKYHNEHYWNWDLYGNERNKSFRTICDIFGFQLFDYDGSYGVDCEPFDAEEVKGIRRVVAYINNHYTFKRPMFSIIDKKDTFYKEHANSLALSRYADWMPTGYTSDYCCKEAYERFIEWVKEFHKVDTCTLQDFMHFLEDAFNHELNNDYDFYNSDESALEALEDDWFAEDGTNITCLIEE